MLQMFSLATVEIQLLAKVFEYEQAKLKEDFYGK